MQLKLKKLPRRFYDRNTIVVAKDLLGKYLVHRIQGKKRIGMIVEVEAYIGPHDLASHSSRGMTKANYPMFGEAGHAYVFLVYGIYYCFNIVTEKAGHGSAILLRALEPVKDIRLRTQGPGLLTNAMGITKKLNGHDLLSSDLYIAEAKDTSNHTIIKAPRIGVDYAKHWSKRLLRFYIKGNPYVSKVVRKPR